MQILSPCAKCSFPSGACHGDSRGVFQSLKDSWPHCWVQEPAGKTRVGLVQPLPPSPPSLVWSGCFLPLRTRAALRKSLFEVKLEPGLVCSSPLTESLTCPAWKLWGEKEMAAIVLEHDFLDEIISVFTVLVVVWGVNAVTKIFVLKLVRTWPVEWSVES